MDYFEFYGLPVSFLLDEQEVKRRFFMKSRKLHPDFHVQADSAHQDEMLRQSTFNTQAFQTLSDFDRRMKYILEVNNQMQDGERYILEPAFLMEMMDLNEGISELNSKADLGRINALKKETADYLERLYLQIKPSLIGFDENPARASWSAIKEYYYRRRYLLRIMQSLDSFGAS